MATVLVTGSAGLIGSEAVRFFSRKNFTVIGIDNNMREAFFGKESSTNWNRDLLIKEFGARYIHHSIDIRDQEVVSRLFSDHRGAIDLIIHTAGQPSHDWAARDPYTDFSVNANGTLVLLESARRDCPEAVFVFCSTNKVYGDTPNSIPLVEKETRWEIEETHRWRDGIDETMSIDQSKHSLFGASKAAADLLVQEYGRYFGMRTVNFRACCLTGPAHSSAELHGFLAYLMKCVATGAPYKVYGYKGKQVRDNIHSYDLVNAFYHFYQAPRVAEVYNMGGSRFSHCSMLEAIELCQAIAGKKLKWSYVDENRSGDHIWWISDVRKFRSHYPGWSLTRGMEDILKEIYAENIGRWDKREP